MTTRSNHQAPPKSHPSQRNIGTYYISVLDDERKRLASLDINVPMGANPVAIVAALADEVIRLRGEVRQLERFNSEFGINVGGKSAIEPANRATDARFFS